jgi:CxC2 like cysteine cluster associated with KDZ transposases
MRQWLDKKDQYLDEIVSLQAAPLNSKCSRCALDSLEPLWRCKECIGFSVLCEACCTLEHVRLPLHRVEVWNKDHFSPSWLWKIGAGVNLCTSNACDPVSSFPSSEGSSPDDEDQASQWQTNDDFTFGADPKVCSIGGRKVLIVIHLNGVHYLPFHFCRCSGHAQDDLQLLRHGFYPATFKNIRTVFTFQLLDDYLLDILECHTSTFHYYSKLVRLTDKPFPHTVPVSIANLVHSTLTNVYVEPC